MDKHKIWLGVGIAFVVLAIGILFFASTGNLAGRGGDQGGVGRGGSQRTPTPTPPVVSILICPDVQLLPALQVKSDSSYPNSDYFRVQGYRKEVCESANCGFAGLEGDVLNFDSNHNYNPSDDECINKATKCPDVAKYTFSGVDQNDGRRKVCEKSGCVFTDGGDNTANLDSCTAMSSGLEANGAACTGGVQCASGVCKANKCVAKLANGGTCAAAIECLSNICTGGKCVAPATPAANTGTVNTGGGKRCISKYQYTAWTYCNSTLQQSRSGYDIACKGSSPRNEIQSCSSCDYSWVCESWSNSAQQCGTRKCFDEHNCKVCTAGRPLSRIQLHAGLQYPTQKDKDTVDGIN